MRRTGLFTLLCAVSIPSAFANLTIQFDYSYDTSGFFSSPTRQAALQAAGTRFSTFSDNLTAVSNTTSPWGPNTWEASFYNPSVNGAMVNVPGLVVPANTLIVYVGGASLGGSTLGQGAPGGVGLSYYEQSFGDNVLYRGQSQTGDFGPWGGSISFDSSTNWYFGGGTIASGQIDFLSVAEHELAHVLGFGTADSWNALTPGSTFLGSTTTAIYGSNPALSSDGSHWNNGTMSQIPAGTVSGLAPGLLQETAMDPDIAAGQVKDFTVLDYAGMKDIGWQVPQNLLSVPEPGTVAMALGAMTLMLSRRRRSALKPAA